jgi:hypothetical protein
MSSARRATAPTRRVPGEHQRSEFGTERCDRGPGHPRHDHDRTLDGRRHQLDRHHPIPGDPQPGSGPKSHQPQRVRLLVEGGLLDRVGTNRQPPPRKHSPQGARRRRRNPALPWRADAPATAVLTAINPCIQRRTLAPHQRRNNEAQRRVVVLNQNDEARALGASVVTVTCTTQASNSTSSAATNSPR